MSNQGISKREAIRRSHMYKQGNQWIVTTWDEGLQMWRDSYSRPWGEACQALRDARDYMVNPEVYA